MTKAIAMRTTFSLLSLCAIGCSCAPNLALPTGMSCAKQINAGPTSSSLIDALSRAERGTCVVAAPAKYTGSFTVPAGVIFGAESGTKVELIGDNAAKPVIALNAGATLTGVRISSAPGVGIASAGGTHLLGVHVESSLGAGIVFWCEEDCRTGDPAELRDVELTNDAVGLLVHGARVNTFGGKVSGSAGSTLASGYGVVASNGAELSMSGTVVEGNEALGLLIDGAQDTSVSLAQVTVQNNKGRGVWAQGLLGTMGSPRLSLSDCTVAGNKLVGVGAKGSHGLRIQGGTVGSTAIGQAQSAAGSLVPVGDGIGLFGSSGDVQIDSVTINANERSQVLVDEGSTGLVVQGSTITQGGGQFGVVVQRTAAVVQAPTITTPPMGQELPISAPTLALPTR